MLRLTPSIKISISSKSGHSTFVFSTTNIINHKKNLTFKTIKMYHKAWSYALIYIINVKNFHGSLTTVVRAQNDTSKTANITDTIFDRTYWYSPYKRLRFENRWDQTFCILLITDVLSECKPPPTLKLETKVIRDSYSD